MDNKISIGNAGEYFVAGELERRGFTVALPMSNVKDFDILGINRTTQKQCAIQVKTTKNSKKEWMLNRKSEELVSDKIFYVFVNIESEKVPEYHIVPSSIVADRISESHKKWLETPGKNGQQHNDVDIRTFTDETDEFLDNWSCLE